MSVTVHIEVPDDPRKLAHVLSQAVLVQGTDIHLHIKSVNRLEQWPVFEEAAALIQCKAKFLAEQKVQQTLRHAWPTAEATQDRPPESSGGHPEETGLAPSSGETT